MVMILGNSRGQSDAQLAVELEKIEQKCSTNIVEKPGKVMIIRPPTEVDIISPLSYRMIESSSISCVV